MVPAISEATGLVQKADIFVIIGTSLNVYPAAGLTGYVPPAVPIYLIDPNPVQNQNGRKIEFIREKAGKGVQILIEKLKPAGQMNKK